MFKIAIIGGGLGGLFAALSIHHHHPKQDVQIDIYEQAAQYKEIGAGVGLGPNAARLVEKLGLGEEARRISGNRDGVWFTFRRYDNGDEVLMVPLPDKEKTPQFPVHRAEFLDLLIRAVQQRAAATLHTRKQLQKLEDRGDTMFVTFADGTTTSADLVIGADGIHSAVRSHYVDDQPQYGGMVVYRGLCPISKIEPTWPLSTWATLWMAPGKHLLTFPISNNDTLNVVGFVSTPWEKLGEVKESWTLQCDKADVQEAFKDFAAPVQSILKHMDTNPLKWILFDRSPCPVWSFSEGKVALLGDAAHAMCPHQGAGAGQAIEDGYILGRVLQDYLKARNTSHPYTLEDCLQTYQAIRAPRAEKVQVTSRQAGELYELRSEDVAGLSYEESLAIAKIKLADRMKWIWTEDVDMAYEKAIKRTDVQASML